MSDAYRNLADVIDLLEANDHPVVAVHDADLDAHDIGMNVKLEVMIRTDDRGPLLAEEGDECQS